MRPSDIVPVQPGLIARSALLRMGFSVDEIDRDRKSGRLIVMRRGVYASRTTIDDLNSTSRHALWARAAAAAAPSLVVSHASAAVLHGLPVRDAALSRIQLTRPGGTGGRSGRHRVLHVGSLSDSDVVEINGVRTTSLARTLVDLTRTEPFEATVMAADAALHRDVGVIGGVIEALGRCRHQRGATAGRRALRFADGRSESVGESRFRVFCHLADLPPPELQCEIRDRRGIFVARTDFGYLDCGLLIEFDGMIKYGKLLTQGRRHSRHWKQRRSARIGCVGWAGRFSASSGAS